MNISVGIFFIWCILHFLWFVYIIFWYAIYKIDGKIKYKNWLKSVYKYLLVNKKEGN